MKAIVERLTRLRGVVGCALVAHDGILIYSQLPVSIESDTVSAMVAAIGGSVARATDRLASGAFQQLMVDAQGGKMFIGNNKMGYLVIFTEPDLNVGMVRLEMKMACDQLNQEELL